jgi:hypothetical protein
MKATDDFSNLEEKIYQAYSRDGAILTTLGLYILWAGLCIVAWPFPWDHFGIAAWPTPWNGLIPLCIIGPLLLLMRLAWTKRITVPRLGYAKSAARRDLPRHRKWRYMWLAVAIALPLGVWMRVWLSVHSGMPHTDKEGIVGLAPVIVGIGLATTKINLPKRQFWTIIALTYGLVVLASFLAVDEGWAIGIVGLLLAGLGLVCLRRFLRDYPRREETDEQ